MPVSKSAGWARHRQPCCATLCEPVASKRVSHLRATGICKFDTLTGVARHRSQVVTSAMRRAQLVTRSRVYCASRVGRAHALSKPLLVGFLGRGHKQGARDRNADGVQYGRCTSVATCSADLPTPTRLSHTRSALPHSGPNGSTAPRGDNRSGPSQRVAAATAPTP